jgi:threonine dehydrogenase-like Zn-dependent dehydrogenase
VPVRIRRAPGWGREQGLRGSSAAQPLLDLVRTGAIDPSTVLTQVEDMPTVLDAYETFDRRESGWTKAAIAP